MVKETRKPNWYDKKVFEQISNKGKSFAQLSRDTGISYYSLRKTYNTFKNELSK